MNPSISRRRPSVALLTLGCAKNLLDSEQIASLIEAAGARVVHSVDGCSVAVINTCGFIQPAREESVSAILNAADHKQDGPLRTLIVTGCLGQRYGDQLARELPEVDVVTGVDPHRAAAAALAALGPPWAVDPPSAWARQHRLTPRSWSYLRISYGCSNRCAYCAIPMIRGPLRSRPMGDLLAEARALVDNGVRELNVIGQDTAAYGTDRSGRSEAHVLLRSLARLHGLTWLRLLYVHPAHVTDDLIDVIGGEPTVCPYIDLPLQHASDAVLTRMRRRTDRAAIEKLVDKLRTRIRGVTIRTTFITGFPGETDGNFQELLDFVNAMRFDRLGCFVFSREEGTAAAEMPDQVPEAIAQERLDELMTTQQQIAFELAAARVGARTAVLMEEEQARRLDGLRPARSPHEAPDVDPLVYVEGDAPPTGEFVQVRVVGSMGYDCVARVVEDTD
jgi:ribosomal protein S12 methylthiotransferase